MREDELSAELRGRIEGYCDGALGARDLPGETREEMEAHFRDRVLGYLNGEDKLSEVDAFLLAREHFGNAGEVRGLLGARTNASTGTLWRKIAGFSIATIVVEPIGNALVGSLVASDADSVRSGLPFCLDMLVCTALLLPWLYFTRLAMRSGQRLWFLTWPPKVLLLLLGALYGGMCVWQLLSPSNVSTQFANAPVQLLIFFVQAGQVVLYFWWLDLPAKSMRQFAVAVLGLTLYSAPFSTVAYASTNPKLSAVALLFSLVLTVLVIAILFAAIGALYLGARRLVAVR